MGVDDPPPADVSYEEALRRAETEQPGAARALGSQFGSSIAFMVGHAFGLLALGLGRHWALTQGEARALAGAIVGWINSLPKTKRIAIHRFVRDIFPTWNLLATAGIILQPRVRMTQLILQGRIRTMQEVRGRSNGGGMPAERVEHPATPSGEEVLPTFQDDVLGGVGGGDRAA